MAIIKTAPNGKQVEFPDGTSEETIQKILSQDRFQPTVVEQPEVTEEQERGLIADLGVQALGGARDAVQSGIGLVEKLGDTLGEKTNIGGFVFGDDAENG